MLFILRFSAKITIFVASKGVDEPMKDYPDKMTPEQARTFKDDVL